MRNEAKALSSMLLGHYPGNFVNDINVLALADTLERIGLDIALEVVERAKVEFAKPPSSAQLYAVAREVREEVSRPEPAPMLPMAEPVPMPEEIRVKVLAMTDPDRKRAEREAEIVEENAEWERKRLAARMARRRTDVCDGTGKNVVELEDGRRVCPSCGVEVPDIEAEPVPKPQRRRSWRTGELA